MSAQSSSLLGYGLYFIDVLACLLFCVTLALVGARFGHEQTVPLDLPKMEPEPGAGSDLSGTSISIRDVDGETEYWLGDQPIGLDELAVRLATELPSSVVVRSEESALARVIAIAHGAGVHDIQLAYEAARGDGEKESR